MPPITTPFNGAEVAYDRLKENFQEMEPNQALRVSGPGVERGGGLSERNGKDQGDRGLP